MVDILYVLVFLSIGFITGVASGIFGIGGGVVMVPSLYYTLPLLGVNNSILSYMVIGTSLFAGTFSSFSSGFYHYKSHNVVLNKALLLASGSIISAFITPVFVVKINPDILKIIFGTILLIVSIKMLFENKKEAHNTTNLSTVFLPFFGLVVGIIAAFIGVGGGVLFVPILMYFYTVHLKMSIGTSSVAVAATMLSSAISYAIVKDTFSLNGFQIGYINLFAGIPIGLGAVFGASFGVKIILKSPTKIIKRMFAVLLISVISWMIFS